MPWSRMGRDGREWAIFALGIAQFEALAWPHSLGRSKERRREKEEAGECQAPSAKHGGNMLHERPISRALQSLSDAPRV